jgi:tRNA A-37 threonylcarbamoyl transferase component Bud32
MGREGTAIGQFRLERLLGHGGMGTVYTAIDDMTGREVAVKLLRPDLVDHADFVDRFKAEARTLARLDHPRIARLHGFFAHGDDLLMVMEYVRGTTLAALLRERGALPPAAVVAWASDVFEALHYAHTQDVVHRDVKPANIIIDGQQRARLTDFGIARTLGDSRLTQTGHAVGTVAYMAPEQVIGGQIDGRADLYAAAVVVFEMLTGAIPYTATTTFTLMREVSDGVPRAALEALPAAAAPLRPVLARALSPSPADRYPDGHALRDALREAWGEEATNPAAHTLRPSEAPTAPVETVRPAAPAVAGLSRMAAVAVGVLLLAAGAGGIAWLRAPAPPAASAPPQAAAPPSARVDPPSMPVTAGPPLATPVTAAPATISPPVAAPPDTSSAPSAPADAPVKRSPRVPTTLPTASEAPPADEAPPSESATGSKKAASPTATPAEFTRVVLMMPVEDDDTEEMDVLLRFEGRRLVVADAETRVPLRTVSYGSVSHASYSEVPSRLRAFRGPSHWLDLTVGGEHVVLKLDKRNVTDILAALESRAGVAVQRVTRR